jgi:hypothetical protein
MPHATYPEAWGGQPYIGFPIWSFSKRGFPCHKMSPSCAVVSYTTFSPLPAFYFIKSIGGLFSVALSVASRHLGITQRSALRSSDFPPLFKKGAIAQSTRLKYCIHLWLRLQACLHPDLIPWECAQPLPFRIPI